MENLLDSAQYVNLMFVLIGLIKLIFTKVIPIKTNIKSGRCLVPGSRNVNKYDIQADFMRISRIINLNLNLNLTWTWTSPEPEPEHTGTHVWQRGIIRFIKVERNCRKLWNPQPERLVRNPTGHNIVINQSRCIQFQYEEIKMRLEDRERQLKKLQASEYKSGFTEAKFWDQMATNIPHGVLGVSDATKRPHPHGRADAKCEQIEPAVVGNRTVHTARKQNRKDLWAHLLACVRCG